MQWCCTIVSINRCSSLCCCSFYSNSSFCSELSTPQCSTTHSLCTIFIYLPSCYLVTHLVTCYPSSYSFIPYVFHVFGLLFHPTAKLLYSCGSEGIFAWDYSTAQCIARWKPCSDPSFRVTCLCFIPDRAFLCAGASDGTLFLLDTLNG